MPYKPRKAKSFSDIRNHKEDKPSLWFDDDEDEDEKGSRTTRDDERLFTLPNGVSVRRVRRTDAPAMHAILNEAKINLFFTETTFPQPYSLWRVHKDIDEILDDKSWRRQNLAGPDGRAAVDMHAAALQVLDSVNLEEKLRKRLAHPPEPDPLLQTDSAYAQAKQLPQLPTTYAIADAADAFIGAIDIDMQDALAGAADPDSPADTVFFHEAEITYYLATRHRNQGILTEVLRRFVAWAWHNFAHILRLNAAVFATWNRPSVRVMEKNGLLYEGKITGCVRKGEQYGDLALYFVPRAGSVVEKLWLEREAANSAADHEKDSGTMSVLRKKMEEVGVDDIVRAL